ncbi:hypothetical protein D9619_008276 [Psilocybe cf. subviscida]|uniref:EthD domain-containing protein n=1 Tax=Psilocybe cf. subviscida TaxID=2480587 RepID=A0A8H5AUA6_9AGAR|nr:hypothetical protein D9619_008276 [Psilocybe cf. subviscida]
MALLFVYGEGGLVTDDEFADWYINDHGPLRLTVPGFNTASLYKATDARVPSWLAYYDLDSPATGTSDAYKALATKGSDSEKALVPRLQDLNRSLLTHLTTLTHPDTTSTSLPGAHIVIVSMQLGESQDEDAFNAWYNDEHIRDFLAVPGFLRVRRYKLLSNLQLVGKRETDEPVHTYWAIYDVDRDEFDKTPEFKATTRTPAAAKILSQIKAFNIRRFALHTSLPKPE